MHQRSRYQGRSKLRTMGVARKMQKNRKDCLAKEILLGATGGRDKVEFGIGEECISRTSGHGQKRWFM